jgi:putative transposase
MRSSHSLDPPRVRDGSYFPSLDPRRRAVRGGGRVVSMAALVATGVAMTGERRILGLELSAGNDEGSAWPRFLRSLVERGLAGVRLVISDDHAGLVKAAREQLLGASWQRCRVHLTRNAQDLVPRSGRSMVASAIRSVIEQPDGAAARAELDRVIDGLRPRLPRVAELLTDAEPDLLAHFAFPETHRRQIRSTNPLERLNKEIPVLNWSMPEGSRRRPVRWVTVPRPDSKEISDATSIWWLSSG